METTKGTTTGCAKKCLIKPLYGTDTGRSTHRHTSTLQGTTTGCAKKCLIEPLYGMDTGRSHHMPIEKKLEILILSPSLHVSLNVLTMSEVIILIANYMVVEGFLPKFDFRIIQLCFSGDN